MLKAVLDTNVLLRAMIRRRGPSGQVWSRHHDYVLCSSPDTITEFVEVGIRASVRAKVTGLTDASVEEVAAALREGACVGDLPELHVCRDPEDDKFLACALAAGADYIVTEDKDLLVLDGYGGLRIITPTAFAAVLDQ